MQSFVSWYASDNTSNLKSLMYYAYIDCDRCVCLSSNVREKIKFVNSALAALACLQLKVFYNNVNSLYTGDAIETPVCILYVLFENGIVETLSLYEDIESMGYIHTCSSTPHINILKIENVNSDLCMLTSTGKILINSKVLFDDVNIVDIKGFKKLLVVFYLNKDIQIYYIELASNQCYACLKWSVYDEILENHKEKIKNVYCYTNILILELFDGCILSNKVFVDIKKTQYYRMIRCTVGSYYYYFAISNSLIHLITTYHINSNFVFMNSIEQLTTETCFDINATHSLLNKNLEFYKSLEYLYSYRKYSHIVLVMLDHTIRTFIDNATSIIEVFDVFESYNKLYLEFDGSYI